MSEEIPDLKIVSITENEDGSANVQFDISDEWQAWFLEHYKLSEWSQEFFEKWFHDAVKFYLEEVKSDKADKSQDPDFLWNTPENV